MSSACSRKAAASRDDSCLSVADLSRIGNCFMVKKIPEMHIVFIALLEDPKECSPSTYNFRREPGICELFLSHAMKGCCKEIRQLAFCLMVRRLPI
jgi:hypothetical protein